ncbi:hypothetical protein GCM10017691_18380 [Pseudonocardia petroleophila]|uniref:Integral membrane protein n=1 Tax=Pseudonocardia petroleophila TaxID=37331 RepID=A0A7G7MH51_9PSEU|nr:hypothetical protein [Pseudonocardia petroleophila]QNG52112.1 hypothetical protein H6H00_29375 [Pseudonocardia petroleophila]
MNRPATTDRPRTASTLTAVAGAALALAVTVVHVLDQGGPTALKDPAYLGYGYWLLELAGLACAVLILARSRAGWLLAIGVAAGPLLGIVVSRSVGLPDATDDIGNWAEPLGVLSMLVEAALLVLAVAVLSRAPHRRRAHSGSTRTTP